MESSFGELIFSGVKLMFIGMGIVYLFLALLVWVIGATSRLIQRFSPEVPTHLPHPAPRGDTEENDVELVAAITAAIHSHQNKS